MFQSVTGYDDFLPKNQTNQTNQKHDQLQVHQLKDGLSIFPKTFSSKRSFTIPVTNSKLTFCICIEQN